MTLDERGCVVFYRQGVGWDQRRSSSIASRSGSVVDTTGAGDSFAAGLGYGYLEYQRLRRGLPVRQRHGRAALHRCGAERLPVTRGDASGRSSRPTVLDRRRSRSMDGISTVRIPGGRSSRTASILRGRTPTRRSSPPATDISARVAPSRRAMRARYPGPSCGGSSTTTTPRSSSW